MIAVVFIHGIKHDLKDIYKYNGLGPDSWSSQGKQRCIVLEDGSIQSHLNLAIGPYLFVAWMICQFCCQNFHLLISDQ